MSKPQVKNRKILVEQAPYSYSVREGQAGIDLLVYEGKRLALRLRQSWVEGWGVPFSRPGVAAAVIRYYRRRGMPSGLQYLCRERELLLELAGLCFARDEPLEKTLFLQRCASYTELAQKEANTDPGPAAGNAKGE